VTVTELCIEVNKTESHLEQITSVFIYSFLATAHVCIICIQMLPLILLSGVAI
jgi:hypothetical protein